MYSQNDEDEVILNWFQKKCESKEKPFSLLDIGAHDGKIFSNSLLFIENGWEAHLLEPSSVYSLCKSLHQGNKLVNVYQLGIGEKTNIIDFYEGGEKTEAQFLTFQDFVFKYNLDKKRFDFISIDAEGLDWGILSQIDLDLHETQCVCVEWNSLNDLDLRLTEYCNNFGLYEEERNAENIIFVR